MPWLPAQLPAEPTIVWRRELSNQGLGGVAAVESCVIVSDRDLSDSQDIFRGLDPRTGAELWQRRYPATGQLDYGNSPRATPLVYEGHAYLLGAFGQLTCVEIATGRVVWKRHIRRDFAASDELVWGACSSPLVVDGRLIVNPGSRQASLAALDPKTGAVLWKTAGRPAAFASFVVARVGMSQQLIGYDRTSLGGWNAADGRRLWELVPPAPDDFNVPTPILDHGRIIVSTENNGTRMYRFAADGRLEARPTASCKDLASDTQTPVVCSGRLIGVCSGLYCLDIEHGLKTVWQAEEPAFAEYATLMASDNRVLLTAQNGQIVLIDPTAEQCQIVGRWQLFKDESGLYSHPAMLGSTLLVRGTNEIVAVDLSK